MAEVPTERLMQRLWPMGDDEGTFALVDGARDPAAHPFLVSSRLATHCLYLGTLDPALARVAPYLVLLPRDAPATRELIERAWGNSWGVFVRARVQPGALHRHFRRLLRVQDQRGRRMLFRFYDPRVLRAYLPTCQPDELEQVFGPVGSFVMEAEDPAVVLEFRNNRGALVRDEARSEKRLAWLGDYLRKSREGDAGKP